jgi:oxygen-independent coproporphyrinogen III oxidase
MGSLFDDVDIQLLKKYDRPGPRYTSYPTAPMFTPSFTAQDFRQEIITTNAGESTGDISLYFHLPFCDTLCYFCGCTMLVTRNRTRIAEYLDYLKREIHAIAPLIGPRRRVVQVHWGGGTPTHLSPDEIREIGEEINSSFNIDPGCERSVELDPREMGREHLEALRSVGFNRMSMGVQDFTPRVQEAINRIQPEELTRRIYDWARELGFTSINLDLIYGLPYQTVASFEKTVATIVDFAPDRVAVFNYAHVPWLKPHQKLIPTEFLPTPDQKLALLKMTIENLSAAGYLYIGMDHFARPEDELSRAQKEKTLYRNFQGYSTRSGADLYGFGMSAISHFQSIYAQNIKELNDYYAAIDAGGLATHLGYRMTADDRIRKHVIMRLMCDLELSIPAIERQFEITFNEYFAEALPALQEFVDDGLVTITPETIRIVGAGRLLLRNIAMCFDAYLDRVGKNRPLFSRTV